MTDLTEREWQLLEAMRRRELPVDIARSWGATPQAVDHVRRGLETKGVIVRDPGVPGFVRYSTRYPWIESDLGREVRYRPALPKTAVLRALYPADSRRDRSVAPIRFVRWDEGGWSVQGVPVCPPDGKKSDSAVPDRKVVWCLSDAGQEVLFTARVGQRWLESYTVERIKGALTVSWRQVLTAMIGAAVGVGVVWDLGTVPDWAGTGTGLVVNR